jgi:hypothetical protein
MFASLKEKSAFKGQEHLAKKRRKCFSSSPLNHECYCIKKKVLIDEKYLLK